MRRSSRLSAVVAQRNGTAEEKCAVTSKRPKLVDNELSQNNQDAKLHAISGNNVRKGVYQENSKTDAMPKSPTIDARDTPLKDRLKNNVKRISEEALSKGEPSESNHSVADVESDDKASTSHTCTEDIVTMGFDSTSIEGESLAVLLGQGLTSSDAEKIDAVLSKTDLRIISATLNDLSVTQIVPLLKEIDHRCRNRKRLDSGWIRWLQCILSKHMAFLSTIGTLKCELSTLFAWVKHRTENINQLLEVNGKLALVNEQISRRMCPQMFINQQATISFEDDGDALSDDSDDVDEADNDEESMGSVQDWWDDEEIASENDDQVPSDEKGENMKDDDSDNDDDDMEDEDDEGIVRMVID